MLAAQEEAISGHSIRVVVVVVVVGVVSCIVCFYESVDKLALIGDF